MIDAQHCPTSIEMPNRTTSLHRVILSQRLPRHPQMLVWGTPVTPEQAMEVIIRSDLMTTDVSGIHGGNDESWNQVVRKTLGLQKLHDYCLNFPQQDQSRFLYSAQLMLRKALKAPRCAYVSTDWLSTIFVHGAHGWCHPDGTVAYIDTIGKKPTPREVLLDWSELAAAFPFLDLTVTLMSEPYTEPVASPFMSIRVKLGKANLLNECVVPAQPPLVRDPSARDLQLSKMGSNAPDSELFAMERGVDEEYLKAMAKRMEPAIQTVYKRMQSEFPRVLEVGLGLSAP